MSKRKYPYAVMDGNQNQGYESPESVHMTKEAAIRAAEKANRENPNYNYFAVEWGHSRWARDLVGDMHPIT